MTKKKPDDPSDEDVKNFNREILILKCIGHHRNIVSIIGCCKINAARPMLVVEYCSQGDLQTYLRTVSLNEHSNNDKQKALGTHEKSYIRVLTNKF